MSDSHDAQAIATADEVAAKYFLMPASFYSKELADQISNNRAKCVAAIRDYAATLEARVADAEGSKDFAETCARANTLEVIALQAKVKELDERHVRFMVQGGPVVMATEFDSMKERAEKAEALVVDQQATFDLMWAADQRAIKQWQEATGQDHIWPDRAKLTTWLLERAEALAVSLRDVGETRRWIPVSERLPDLTEPSGCDQAGTESVFVLAWSKDGGIDVAVYCSYICDPPEPPRWGDRIGLEVDAPSHWMPLPEPPLSRLSVAPPRIRCELCGHFVETAGHASDCGNMPTKQEVDLLLSDSQTVAYPTAEERDKQKFRDKLEPWLAAQFEADDFLENLTDHPVYKAGVLEYPPLGKIGVAKLMAAFAADYAATLEARVAAQKSIIATLGEGKAAAEERAEKAEADAAEWKRQASAMAADAIAAEARVGELEQLRERERAEDQQYLFHLEARADALAVSLRDVGETLLWIEQESIDTAAVNKARKALSRLSTHTKTGDNHER